MRAFDVTRQSHIHLKITNGWHIPRLCEDCQRMAQAPNTYALNWQCTLIMRGLHIRHRLRLEKGGIDIVHGSIFRQK
jgi:hypothetical protein